MLSRPDLDTYEPVPDSLVPVFRQIAVDREVTAAVVDEASRARSLYSASYPQRPGAQPLGGAQVSERSRRSGLGVPGQGRSGREQ
jgi:cell filamentation protein